MFNTKVIIGLVIAAILAGGYYAWDQKTKSVNELTTKVAVAKIVEKSAEDTITKTIGSSKISEEVSVAIVEKTIAIAAKQNTIREGTISNVTKVEKEYSLKPQTPDYQKELNDKTSAIMIDGFWDAYCLGMPQASGCVKQL